MVRRAPALNPRSSYRTLGPQPLDRIGAGVMDKSGVRIDHRDFRPAAWSVVHVLRGRGSYLDGAGRAWPLAAGSCFQRHPGTTHSTILDPASGWLEAFVDLGGRLHEPLAEMRVLRREPPVWSWGARPDWAQRVAALADRLGAAGERDLPSLAATAVALAVEPFAAAPADAPDDPIDEACRLLAEHPEQRIDLAAWCAARGLDYERFRKDFRRRTGLPPHRYRIRRRIDRACALLRAGQSVQATARALGYPAPFDFSAQFRAQVGVPPSRWRG